MEDLVINKDFWSGKTVFLTGHTGFKGSWLSLWLQQLGANVIGYALPPATKPSLFELARVADGMTHLQADIRDLDQLKAAIQTHQPQIIIHMAAQALVQDSYGDPVTTYSTNVMGTVNLFEAARHAASVKIILNVTSDKCYENQERDLGYREDEPMGGSDPYSNSKGCAELVTQAYRRSFFAPADWSRHGKALASARAGNVIGGGDWSKQRLIPDIIAALAQDRAPLLRHPDAIRPWQHVLDCLSGYLLLVQRLWEQPTEFAQGWNFGPVADDIRSVRWVTNKLITLWGQNMTWQLEQQTLAPEAKILKLDIAKAKNQLGWLPRLPLEQALEYVVRWYQAWLKQQDLREFTLAQILEYTHAKRN